MKRTPLKRKTPLNSVNPVNPRTPIRKKKPSVAASQYLQRRQLVARSGSRCEFEVLSHGRWIRCTRRAEDPCHVYTRPKCGKARDLLEAVIHGCRLCHDASKGLLAAGGVRVPLRYAQGAWEWILAYSRLGVDAEDRLRIHLGSVGPRPEKGIAPYES